MQEGLFMFIDTFSNFNLLRETQKVLAYSTVRLGLSFGNDSPPPSLPCLCSPRFSCAQRLVLVIRHASEAVAPECLQVVRSQCLATEPCTTALGSTSSSHANPLKDVRCVAVGVQHGTAKTSIAAMRMSSSSGRASVPLRLAWPLS